MKTSNTTHYKMANCIGNWQHEIETLLQNAKQNGTLREFAKMKCDSDKVRFVYEKKEAKSIPWVSFYFENCSKLHRKSAEKAALFRSEGNASFQKKQFKDAIQKYIQAILFAPPDSEELSLGYGNKSAASFHVGDFQTCLQDIELAETMGYPLQSRYKLAVRKANSLYKISRWTEAGSAAREALEYLQRADVPGKKYDLLVKEMKELENCKERERMLEDDGQHGTPELSYGKSSVLVQASGALELQCNAEQGRHIVTNRDIKAGDTLIVEKPFAAVLLPDHYPTHCHHCFTQLRTVVPCRRCTVVRFCSLECREKAWKVYHHIECHCTDLLHSVGIAHLSLRIVLVAGLRFLIDFVKSQSQGECHRLRTPGLDEDGKYCRNYLTVYDLMTHSDDICVEDMYQYCLTAGILLELLQHCNWFHQQNSTNHVHHGGNDTINTVSATTSASAVNRLSDSQTDCVSDVSLEDLSLSNTKGQSQADDTSDHMIIIGGLLLRHIQQLVCNAHAITELQVSQSDLVENSQVEEKSQVRVATAIYPTASLMNHSCDPTIISSFHKDTLVVRSVKVVAKGGEIFNCYGPHHKRMSWNERQQVLKEQYFFTCRCPSCTSGREQEATLYALLCSLCSGPLCEAGETFTCQQCEQTSACQVEMEQVRVAEDKFQAAINLLQQGEYKAALSELLDCYKVGKKVMYRFNKRLSDMEDCIARCYASLGQFKKAAKYLQKSVEVVKVVYGSGSIEVANEMQKLSEVLISAQQWSEALSVTEEAVAIFTVHYGRSHDTVLDLCKMKYEIEEVIKSVT